MFTGLIEDVGVVLALERTSSGRRLRMRTALASALRPGDSVAVNGVCVTVTHRDDDGTVSADVGPETVRVTTTGRLEAGDALNIERPVSADGRFGGHFVQGHVDGMGTVVAVREEDGAHWMTIEVPAALEPLLIHRGSVSVDGVSLTVAGLDGAAVHVMVIPFTWAHTNLGSKRIGDSVNIECDMVGKYVARALERASRDR